MGVKTLQQQQHGMKCGVRGSMGVQTPRCAQGARGPRSGVGCEFYYYGALILRFQEPPEQAGSLSQHF